MNSDWGICFRIGARDHDVIAVLSRRIHARSPAADVGNEGGGQEIDKCQKGREQHLVGGSSCSSGCLF